MGANASSKSISVNDQLLDFLVSRLVNLVLLPHRSPITWRCYRGGDFNNLSLMEFWAMRGHDHSAKARVVNGDGSGWRAMQFVKRHAVPPDRRSAFDDDQCPARNLRQGRQRFVRRDSDDRALLEWQLQHGVRILSHLR